MNTPSTNSNAAKEKYFISHQAADHGRGIYEMWNVCTIEVEGTAKGWTKVLKGFDPDQKFMAQSYCDLLNDKTPEPLIPSHKAVQS